jgi:hypothetical protein
MLRFKNFLLEFKMKNPFNPLKITDLRKDENRVLTFLRKIKEKEPFATVRQGDVTIPVSEYDEVKLFMNADGRFPKGGTNMMVQTSKGKLKIPGDFLKTGDFGGRGAGSGTNAETLAMNYFNENLNKILQREGVPQIKLKINGRTVMCAAMVKTEGKFQGYEPKSDMTIVDDRGNPVAYISHKAGRSAKDYQQYGGLSDKALPTKYRNNPAVKKFMQDVNRMRPEGLQSGDSFYRPIKDQQLVKMMMYGPLYGGKPSISNVDEFHLGNMNLKGSGEGPYTIESIHKGTNGEMPDGQFEAVFFIRFQARRGDARAAGEVVKNARVGVFPLAKISGTTKKI